MSGDLEDLDLQLLAYSGNYKSLSYFTLSGEPRKPARVCIMTQDIFGPIKNAGIGTAFMYAADYLSRAGHDITILFTQGRVSHTRPIDYWIDFYKEKGIRFLCADPISVTAPAPALQWSYMGYRSLLRMDPFDIVHSSECGASPYYALMAKRNLGQFRNTIFATKTSSPHLWNRQGNENTINLDSGLIICSAERYCVEKADLVIAPTKHMLDWMVDNGYNLPPNSCVQPNPVPLPQVEAVEHGPGGHAQRIDELVFFGRLEARKGILIFAEALDLLHKSGVKNCKVTFMGKKTDDFNFDELLSRLRTELPFDIKGIHTYDAKQAIGYLQQKGRLAIAPSLIDQAALTAYESIMSGVPFLAANVGGIPEIVHPDDRARTLVLPRPQALFRAMERCLKSGAFTAKLSFVPDRNFKVWDEFHRNIDTALLGPPAEADVATDQSVIDYVANEELSDPINIEDLETQLRASEASFVLLRQSNYEISAADRRLLIEYAANGDFDVLVPATFTKEPANGYLVHYEPSLWNKLEFSKLELPSLVIKRSLLLDVLGRLGSQPLIYLTSLDTIIAVALYFKAKINVCPEAIGYHKGKTRNQVTKRQRARQVEQIVHGLEPDLANLYRLYGGLLDERSRVIAVQAVLKNLQRLLRVLRRLESIPPALPGGNIAKTAPSRLELAGIERGWRGWGRRPLSKARRGRFIPLGAWLKQFPRIGGTVVKHTNPED